MTLRIIATGGTFDKHYNELNGVLGFADSHLPEVLKRCAHDDPGELERCRCSIRSTCRTPTARTCWPPARPPARRPSSSCTAPIPCRETAEVLGAGIVWDKTIVFTGAMIPYEIANSDAMFNFGFACGVAQTLPPACTWR
jgi:L-asparaginase